MLVVCVYVWGKGCVCMYVWGEVCVKEVKMQSRAGQNMFGVHSGERGGSSVIFCDCRPSAHLCPPSNSGAAYSSE